MTAYWLAQGVGVIAFLISPPLSIAMSGALNTAGALQRIIGLQMGALPAGMSAGLNAVRTLISLRTRNLWMVIFIALTLWKTPACDGIVADRRQHLGLFRCKGLTTRCVMWCSAGSRITFGWGRLAAR
jgi:hypothetical protein